MNFTYLPQRAAGSISCTHDLCLTLNQSGIESAVLSKIDPRGIIGLRNRLVRKLYPRNQFPMDRRMGYPVYRGWVPEKAADEVKRRFSLSAAVVFAGCPVPIARSFVEVGIPTVFYLRDVLFEEMGGDLFSHPKLLYMAVSQFTARRAKEEFGIEAKVLPPLIRPDGYRTETTREKVVFVCPYPKKGVEIAFQLAESRPDIPFEFVESWELSDEMLRKLHRRADAAGNITIRRRVPDMRTIYHETKILLIPSVCEEAWGRTVTEAQCSGIPVLASNSGGLPESVGSGGILVGANAPIAEWTQALSRMWDDPVEYERLVTEARNWGARPDIQPETIMSEFVRIVSEHVAKVGGD